MHYICHRRLDQAQPWALTAFLECRGLHLVLLNQLLKDAGIKYPRARLEIIRKHAEAAESARSSNPPDGTGSLI